MPALDPWRLAEQLQTLAPVEHCWVAFSGGLDSTVLLAALAVARDGLPGCLRAVHVDHGLQSAALGWVEHCSRFCSERAIPLETRRLALAPAVGESLEACARAARLGVFSELLGVRDLLLTAHHQDDQAETLLLALMRGSGVQGLAAMPFSARLARGRLVRPLIGYRRADLTDYAVQTGLQWIEDPSNAETAFDRNFLRHQVLPLVRQRWPSAAVTLARSARHCAEAAELVDGLAVQTMMQLVGSHPGALLIPLLNELGRSLQKAVLRAWLSWHGFAIPDTGRLERVLDEVLPARPDAQPLVAWAGCEIRRYREDLFCLSPLPEPPPSGLRIGWGLGDTPAALDLPGGLGCLHWRPDAAGSAAVAAADRAVEVRFGRLGQKCSAGAGAHPRPLKKLFQEAGVPTWLRPYVPLLLEGERLIAVAGVSPCSQTLAEGCVGELRWSGHPWECIGALFATRTPISAPLPAESILDREDSGP